MHLGVDAGMVFGRQLGKTSAPIQGLSTRWGFSRYEAQKMSGAIQSSNYVPGISGWKLDTDTGTFELNSCRAQGEGGTTVKVHGGSMTVTHNGVLRSLLDGLPSLCDK
ncbi:hypothetical protein AO391_26495 [Pseudomonas marginalis ICMP 9505]|nr:hypothetical protein AO391_26495 [Pseudomonas marginalis ICMP 9505]